MIKSNWWFIKWILTIICIIAFIIIFFVSAYHTRDEYTSMYNNAVSLEEEGKYDEAYEVYFKLYLRTGPYKDIVERMTNIDEYHLYSEASKLEESKEYLDAMKIWIRILDFEDSQEHFDHCCQMYLETK